MAVCDYVLTDPLDPVFKEVTTHLIIYHAGLDGRRELYRHFLRMPDGTALELFGDLSSHFESNLGALGDLLTGRGALGATRLGKLMRGDPAPGDSTSESKQASSNGGGAARTSGAGVGASVSARKRGRRGSGSGGGRGSAGSHGGGGLPAESSQLFASLNGL